MPAEAEVERHVVSDMLHAMVLLKSWRALRGNLVGTWDVCFDSCNAPSRCVCLVGAAEAERALPWAKPRSVQPHLLARILHQQQRTAFIRTDSSRARNGRR